MPTQLVVKHIQVHILVLVVDRSCWMMWPVHRVSTTLLGCPSRPISIHNCGHGEDVGVGCEAPCDNGAVRLANGNADDEGRVELCNNNKWGTVCDEGFSSEDAQVVCRQLGYSSDVIGVLFPNVYFGSGIGEVIVSEVTCIGNEDSIFNCSYVSGSNCSHSNDVGVGCKALCTNGDIRLVNGYVENEGRLEICNNNTWGTVCDYSSSFTDTEAQVVCRQLGYLSTDFVIFTSNQFGSGSGLVHAADCNGGESSLLSCSITTASCGLSHNDDVGVRCQVLVNSTGSSISPVTSFSTSTVCTILFSSISTETIPVSLVTDSISQSTFVYLSSVTFTSSAGTVIPTSVAVKSSAGTVVPSSVAVTSTAGTIIPSFLAVTSSASTFVSSSVAITSSAGTFGPSSLAVISTAGTFVPSSVAVTSTAGTVIPSSVAVTSSADTVIPSSLAVTSSAGTVIPSSLAVTSSAGTFVSSSVAITSSTGTFGPSSVAVTSSIGIAVPSSKASASPSVSDVSSSTVLKASSVTVTSSTSSSSSASPSVSDVSTSTIMTPSFVSDTSSSSSSAIPSVSDVSSMPLSLVTSRTSTSDSQAPVTSSASSSQTEDSTTIYSTDSATSSIGSSPTSTVTLFSSLTDSSKSQDVVTATPSQTSHSSSSPSISMSVSTTVSTVVPTNTQPSLMNTASSLSSFITTRSDIQPSLTVTSSSKFTTFSNQRSSTVNTSVLNPSPSCSGLASQDTSLVSDNTVVSVVGDYSEFAFKSNAEDQFKKVTSRIVVDYCAIFSTTCNFIDISTGQTSREIADYLCVVVSNVITNSDGETEVYFYAISADGKLILPVQALLDATEAGEMNRDYQNAGFERLSFSAAAADAHSDRGSQDSNTSGVIGAVIGTLVFVAIVIIVLIVVIFIVYKWSNTKHKYNVANNKLAGVTITASEGDTGMFPLEQTAGSTGFTNTLALENELVNNKDHMYEAMS